MRVEPLLLNDLSTVFYIAKGRGRNEKGLTLKGEFGGWTSKIIFKAACWSNREAAENTLNMVRTRLKARTK